MFKDVAGEIRVQNMTLAVQHPTNSLIAIAQSDSHLSLYDLVTKAPSGAGVLSTSAAPAQIAFVDTNVAAITLTVGTTPYIVNFGGSGSVTAMTSQSLSSLSSTPGGNIKAQLAAPQISAKQAMFLSNNSGNLLTVDYSSGSGVSGKITPAGLSAKTFSCVIAKPGVSNSYLVGTTDGNIYELTFTGTIVRTITPPVTPTFRNSITHPICSLSMDASASNLYATTTGGTMFHYAYSSTPTLIETLCLREAAACPLSENINGMFFAGPGLIGGPGSTYPLYLTGNPTIEIQRLISVQSSLNLANIGLNSASNIAWVQQSGSNTAGDTNLRLFHFDGFVGATGTTRFQLSGSDVSFRSIKTFMAGRGVAKVDLDVGMTAGSQSISFQLDNSTYYELALQGSQGVNETADWRKLQS